MAAKTQDAAGPHATHQPPCPFAGTLRTYDWRERGCCCIEPATPRETALAAPVLRELFEAIAAEPGIDFDAVSDRLGSAMESAQDWLAARLVSAMQDAQDCLAAPSAPQEPREGWSSAMPFEWSDPGSPLTELRMWYDHAVLKAEAARRTGKYPLLLADKDRAFAAMLHAARVPTPIAEPEIMALARRVIEAWESPVVSVAAFDKSLTVLRDALASAPQEPRVGVEPSEGMVERAWLSECERDPRLKTVDAKSVAGEKAAIRSILRAALSERTSQ